MKILALGLVLIGLTALLGIAAMLGVRLPGWTVAIPVLGLLLSAWGGVRAWLDADQMRRQARLS